jgi:hypothetical protein
MLLGRSEEKTAAATMRREVAAWQITRKNWRVYLDFILHKRVNFYILNVEGICRTWPCPRGRFISF